MKYVYFLSGYSRYDGREYKAIYKADSKIVDEEGLQKAGEYLCEIRNDDPFGAITHISFLHEVDEED